MWEHNFWKALTLLGVIKKIIVVLEYQGKHHYKCCSTRWEFIVTVYLCGDRGLFSLFNKNHWHLLKRCNTVPMPLIGQVAIHVVREWLTELQQRWMFCSCSSRRIHHQRRRRYRITNGFNECTTSCPLSTGCAHPWRNQRGGALPQVYCVLL